MNRIINKYLPLAYGAYFNSLATFSQNLAAEKAFKLFCTPRKGKVLPHQENYLNDAKSEVLYLSENRLQTYQWQGEKETVLLMHGWESNVFRWRNLIGFLQEEGYHIIAFDAPGHGNSSGKILNVPLYAQCIQLLVERYTPKYLIGHSMGGMTTLYHQYLHPSSFVEKIVTLGSPSDLSDIMEHYQNLLQFNTKVLEGLDNFFFKKYNFRIPDFSTAKFVQKNSKKGLLVHDEEDTIAPFRASEKVHSHWKNSTLIRTRGLGHSLHQEEINRKIVEFLKL